MHYLWPEKLFLRYLPTSLLNAKVNATLILFWITLKYAGKPAFQRLAVRDIHSWNFHWICVTRFGLQSLGLGLSISMFYLIPNMRLLTRTSCEKQFRDYAQYTCTVTVVIKQDDIWCECTIYEQDCSRVRFVVAAVAGLNRGLLHYMYGGLET